MTKHLKDSGARVLVIAVIAGEGAKSLACVENILSTLAKRNFPKDGALISVGGGTVGDMVGFVASIYKRGVNYIQIPTTFLSWQWLIVASAAKQERTCRREKTW